MKLPAVVVSLAALLLAVPSVAVASVTEGYVADPPDVPATISGVPNQPDLSGLSLRYDSNAGTIDLALSFHTPLSRLDKSSNYAAYAWFGIGTMEGVYGCHAFVTAMGDLYRNSNLNSFSIDGLQGYAPLQATVGDGSATYHLANPNLAGKNYNCVDASVIGSTYSNPENLSSRYDSGCDCWYVPFYGDKARLDLSPQQPPVTPPTSPTKPPPTPPTKPPVKSAAKPYLSGKQAIHYLSVALERGFKARWTRRIKARDFPPIYSCGRPSERSPLGPVPARWKVYCRIGWNYGPSDRRYRTSGSGSVWLIRDPRGVVTWNYAYNVVRRDGRCLRTRRGRARRACYRRYVVR